MKLPGKSGTEVIKQLKNDPELRHIPVQIISGYDHRKEGLSLGAFDYIQKPVYAEDLQKVFNKLEGFINKKLKKLLIVEDNELQNLTIRELIGNGDVVCHSAFSGKDALKKLKEDNYECIILDLGLPDMSGFDLLEKIKTDNDLNKIPVVIYTGRELAEDDRLKLNMFADTVVLKTVNSHERLLDETTLFLHRVESMLPKEKRNLIKSLHKSDNILQNKKILIADDDMRNIYSLTNALTEEGAFCIPAENGQAALNILNEDPSIDIVLMDIMMPVMDGYETASEIRKSSNFKNLPIIALTAKAMKQDKIMSLASGMSDYITKPVDVERLLSLLRIWLAR
jgi:CheY-like chemotaxis protein